MVSASIIMSSPATLEESVSPVGAFETMGVRPGPEIGNLLRAIFEWLDA